MTHSLIVVIHHYECQYVFAFVFGLLSFVLRVFCSGLLALLLPRSEEAH